MDFRGVLLVCALSCAAIVGATSSCSAPDPGQVTFIPRTFGSSGELTSSGTSGTIPEGGVDEAGTEAGTDGGGSSGDPVFGTTTFALGTPGRNGSGQPAKSANAMHAGDSSNKDCIVAGCHQGGWAFGGTLYTDAAGTARVPNAEVRVTGPDGKEYAKTYTDADGLFWIDALSTPIPVNSRVGVRTADKKKTMATTIAAGQAGCSQGGTCHGQGGTAGKVFLN